MKNILFICLLVCHNTFANAQNTISGTVKDQDHLPLIGATIFIPDMNKGTITDNNGNYKLYNLPNGKIKIQCSFMGYANHIESVEIYNNSTTLNISLKPTIIEAEEIVVSGGYNATQHENAVKIEVLKLNINSIKGTPNFTEALAQIPGVDMISKGSGIAKPVIRGLSMNDILILNNGVRFENYQYSSHHPLGIDEFGIDGVEIIKGPASLLYGSDAIGGVINFIKEKPAPVGTIQGDYNLQLFSNTLGASNNLGFKGTSKKYFGGVRIGQKTHADFLQGGGTFVPNSRFNEHSLKTNVGFTDKIGTFKLFYDYNNQQLGLVEDEAIEAITERGRRNQIWYQSLNTHLLSSQNKLYLNRFKLDLNAAFQNTELAHWGKVDEVEIQMNLATLTYEAKLHLPSKENQEYIIGFQGFNQTNSNLNQRETLLLPNASTNNYSIFGLLQHTFLTKLKVQTGLRYDKKFISTQAIGLPSDSASYRAALRKDYGSLSGSIGATYHINEDLLFRSNFASAYRTPNLAELTSNGRHELRYELGDANLIPENAYEGDLSLHYHKKNITVDAAGFYNKINHYLFIAPTGDTTSNGLSIYQYKQANATLFGGETGLHIHPKNIKWLHFNTNFALVIGKQKNGNYLPFIPAHKLKFELRAEKEQLAFLQKAFLTANTSTAFKQNNAAPDEETTSSYSLLDLSIGGNIKIKEQFIAINLSVNNVLDKIYIDHLSTLREANFYNPGRNFSLSMSIPFGIKNN